MSFNKMYGTFPSGRWLFTGTLSGGTDFPLLDLFTYIYMSRWSWRRAPSATAIHSSEWCPERSEKSRDDLLPKIFNTLCGDQLRPGPPPLLLKVKNWRPPQLPRVLCYSVTGSMHFLSFREVYQKDFTPTCQMSVNNTCCVFNLKDTFKIPYTLEG